MSKKTICIVCVMLFIFLTAVSVFAKRVRSETEQSTSTRAQQYWELGNKAFENADYNKALELYFQALNLYIVGLAIFDKLGVVVIAHPNLVPFVGQIGGIRILVLPDKQFPGVLRFSMVLVPHFEVSRMDVIELMAVLKPRLRIFSISTIFFRFSRTFN